MPSPEPLTDTSLWHARLELAFARRHERTVLAKRRHHGPLVVQKPFYPEGAPCHCYVLHPPGGVVGGDNLEITADVQDGAHALITTPAAGKFYRSDGRQATLQQTLKVADGALLEWLPQEAIFFSGCNVHAHTRFELQSTARLIAWEIVCLGRPASHEYYENGECTQRLEIWRRQAPLFLERACYVGDSEVLSAAWGLANHNVSGTMLITPADKSMLDQVREIQLPYEAMLFSASLMNDILVCRVLGQQGEQVRQLLIQVWQMVRPQLAQRPANVPRIWLT